MWITFLKLTSKSRFPVLSHQLPPMSLYALHFLPIFVFLCYFSTATQMFSLFFFVDSLNCKVACQLILKWKVFSLVKFWKSFEVAGAFSSVGWKELWMLISNTMSIFIANKLSAVATISTFLLLKPSVSLALKLSSCLWMFGMKLAKLG